MKQRTSNDLQTKSEKRRAGRERAKKWAYEQNSGKRKSTNAAIAPMKDTNTRPNCGETLNDEDLGGFGVSVGGVHNRMNNKRKRGDDYNYGDSDNECWLGDDDVEMTGACSYCSRTTSDDVSSSRAAVPNHRQHLHGTSNEPETLTSKKTDSNPTSKARTKAPPKKNIRKQKHAIIQHGREKAAAWAASASRRGARSNGKDCNNSEGPHPRCSSRPMSRDDAKSINKRDIIQNARAKAKEWVAAAATLKRKKKGK